MKYSRERPERRKDTTQNQNVTIRRKAVVVGDSKCGKTALLTVYNGLEFPELFTPTVFENSIARIELKKKNINLSLWDTAGQEDYDRLRPLSYPESDVIILIYSSVKQESYDHILTRWIPELAHFLKGVKIILVATMCDVRDKMKSVGYATSEEHRQFCERMTLRKLDSIPREKGEYLAKQIGAEYFIECSPKTTDNVKLVIDMAGRIAAKELRNSPKPDRPCKVM